MIVISKIDVAILSSSIDVYDAEKMMRINRTKILIKLKVEILIKVESCLTKSKSSQPLERVKTNLRTRM